MSQPPTAPCSWERTYPGTAREVGTARGWVHALLDGYPAAADAVQVFGELANNAVMHTASGFPRGAFRVAVEMTEGGVRLAVSDQGARTAPCALPFDTSRDGGRGLALVAAYTSGRWWVTGDDTGRTVTAELRWDAS
ncbi:MAG: ATP-binding protein [Streptomycetales bacterium]